MKSYLKYIACFLAVLLVTATIAYSIVVLRFSPIADLAVVGQTKNSVTLYWQKQPSVTGYKIYMSNGKDKEYKEIKTISSGEKNKVVIDGLKQDQKYSFCVAPYKTFISTTKQGAMCAPVYAYTWPAAQKIDKITESNVGVVTVSWTGSNIASGYELEYSPFKDFSYSEKIQIKGKDSTVAKLENLLSGKVYYFRVRTYATHDKKTIYSEFSKTKKLYTQNEFLDVEIDPTKPVIALTFDDGPSGSNSTQRILDVLEKYDVSATFFCVGENAKNRQDTLKRMLSLGCEIGNHTYSHKKYGDDVTKKEISACSDAIEQAVGYRPVSMRATGGITNKKIKKWAKAQDMSLYYWSIDTRDWKTRNTKKIIKKIMKAKDGDIILMHDIYNETAAAIEKAVPRLVKKGYQFVTVSQLVKIKQGHSPDFGVEYVTGNRTKGE